jgi:transcriptional regulator with XRE-family HTH domain
MGNIAKEIKRALKNKIRSQKAINQKTVADALGVTQGSLSQILADHRKGTLEQIIAIAEACGTTLGEIERQLKVGQPPAHAPQVGAADGARFSRRRTDPLSLPEIGARFQDQEAAKRLAFMLSEIERLDPARFEVACDLIRSLYEKAAHQKKQHPGRSAG